MENAWVYKNSYFWTKLHVLVPPPTKGEQRLHLSESPGWDVTRYLPIFPAITKLVFRGDLLWTNLYPASDLIFTEHLWTCILPDTLKGQGAPNLFQKPLLRTFLEGAPSPLPP